jgi:molecular chaperone GrpE
LQQDEQEYVGVTDNGSERVVDAVDELKEQLRISDEKARQCLANWQRTQADFENYRKRMQQERRDAMELAHSSLVAKLLGAIDDLERAFTRPPEERGTADWVEGVRLADAKLVAALESEGLSVIQAVGQPFDPRFHDAVMRQPGENGVVMAVLQKGYTLNGRVLRPAAVAVGMSESTETVEKE